MKFSSRLSAVFFSLSAEVKLKENKKKCVSNNSVPASNNIALRSWHQHISNQGEHSPHNPDHAENCSHTTI
jgi:hypothetical protein